MNNNINNINNEDYNNKDFIKKNNFSENKNINLYKKATFTSNNKTKDPIRGEKSKNVPQNKNKIKNIKK